MPSTLARRTSPLMRWHADAMLAITGCAHVCVCIQITVSGTVKG
jgi:hypothetical protein